MPDALHTVRVGPAGWSYEDWKGIVYPSDVRRLDPLSYLADFFDTIEVNSSFYRTPPPSHAASWIRRVKKNDAFSFSTKLFQGFTHEPHMPAAAEIEAFHAYLEPMLESGKFGALLAQFPWSFRDGSEARKRIAAIAEAFAEIPLVVEIRHGSFASDEFFEFLDDIDVGFANIDQPIIGDSFRPTSIVTGPVGYVRLHGRNYEKWFDHAEAWERYDYLYSDDELEPWIEKIKTAAKKKDVYVVTNNHFRGQAIVNAVELKRGLGQDAPVPPALFEEYPDRLG